LQEVLENKTDQVLGLVFLASKVLYLTFVKKDFIKAIETKMKIEAHYSSFPIPLSNALNALSIINYA
jgi:hypothetical protein